MKNCKWYPILLTGLALLLAGSVVACGEPTPAPSITFSPSSLSFSAEEGEDNPPNKVLDVSNSGGGTLEWSLSETPDWLIVSPSNGTSAGETDRITVSVDIQGISVGNRTATIRLAAPRASNTPQTIVVNLSIKPSSLPPPAAESEILLKVNHIKQLPDYCGEACYSMAAHYLGKPVSQEEVHSAGGKNLSRGLYSYELRLAAKPLGLLITEYLEIYDSRQEASKYVDHSINRIIPAIRQGKPVMSGYYPLDNIDRSYLGHFILIVGFNETEKYLFVHDPLKDSGPDKVTFDEFWQLHAMPSLDYQVWVLLFHIIELE